MAISPEVMISGIVILIGVGSAVGGYMARPRMNGNGKSPCKYHEAVTQALGKGDQKFQCIDEKLTEHGELLARIDERTKRMVGD